MPLYKATKIVLVLKKGGKNPIPCLFIIEGNNYSNLTNQSSVCCARLQEILQFSNLPPQNTLLTASILEAQIKNSSCFSLKESSVFRASLQNKLQTLFLGVQNHVLCLSIIEGKNS